MFIIVLIIVFICKVRHKIMMRIQIKRRQASWAFKVIGSFGFGAL